MKSNGAVAASILIIAILVVASAVYFHQRAPSPLPAVTTQGVVPTNSLATVESTATNLTTLVTTDATSGSSRSSTQLQLIKELADPPPGSGGDAPAHPGAQRMHHLTNAQAKFEPGKMGPLGLMKQQLNLTEDQAKRLEPILKEQNKRWSAFRHDPSLSRKERAAKLKELQAKADTELKTVLTTEQFEKWHKRGQNHREGRQQTNSPPAHF